MSGLTVPLACERLEGEPAGGQVHIDKPEPAESSPRQPHEGAPDSTGSDEVRQAQFLQRSKLRPARPASYRPDSLPNSSLSPSPSNNHQNNNNNTNTNNNNTNNNIKSKNVLQQQQSANGKPTKVADPQQMHVCRLCDKLLSSSSSLDRHMLTHSGIRPFVCKRCNMTFTTNGNMHRHMRTHLHKDSLARQQHEQQLKSLMDSSKQLGSLHQATHNPAPALAAAAGAKLNPIGQLTKTLLSQPSQTILANDYLMPLTSPLGPKGAPPTGTSSSTSSNNINDISRQAIFSAAAAAAAAAATAGSDPLSLLAQQHHQIAQLNSQPDSGPLSALLSQQLSAALNQQTSQQQQQHSAGTRGHIQQSNQSISSMMAAAALAGPPGLAAADEAIKGFLRQPQIDFEGLMLSLGQSHQLPGDLDAGVRAERHRLGLESVKAVMFAAAAAANAVSQQQSHSLLAGSEPGSNPPMESANQLQPSEPRSIRGKPRKQVNPKSTRQSARRDPLPADFDREDSAPEDHHEQFIERIRPTGRASRQRNQPDVFMEAANSDQDDCSMSSVDDSGSFFNQARSSSIMSTHNHDKGEEHEQDDDDLTDSEDNGNSSSLDSMRKLTPTGNNCPAPIKWEAEKEFDNNNNNNHNNNSSNIIKNEPDNQVNSSFNSLDDEADDEDNFDNPQDQQRQTSLDNDNQPDPLLANSLTSLDGTIVEDISQSYVKTANPNAVRKGGKRNRHCYKCKLCTYSSVDRCTLVRHLRIHSGERPYICGICRYAFTTKANCERHVKKRHKRQYNSLGGAGGGSGVKGSNGGGRSLIITDHSNHQTIPVEVNPVAAQTISQTLQRIQEKQEQASSTLIINNNNNSNIINNNNNNNNNSNHNSSSTQCNSRKIDNLFFNDDLSQALDLSFKLQK